MWRTLFRERLRLAVHLEPRDTAIYALVPARADRRLGPQLTRSPHDCAALTAAPPPPTRATLPSDAEVLATCGSLFLPGRMIVGGTQLSTFATTLGASGLVDRLVEDRTGLDGYYTFTLTYAPAARPGADSPGTGADAPSIFTALREQLGLELQPARTSLQTVVIDRLEPPTEN